MGTKKLSRPAPTVGKPSQPRKAPLAPQLKHTTTNKKRSSVELVARPFLIPQYTELSKEDRDIVLDRLQKEVVEASVTVPSIKRFIVRGVNQASRLIARKGLHVVVFASNPDTSSAVFGHIPLLCRLHKVPLCVLHLSSKALGSVFQQKSVSVVGIKRLPKRTTRTEKREDIEHVESEPLDDVTYDKIQSISEFLVSKASTKNHSLQ